MLEKHIDSYGKGIPYLPNTKVKGRLIAIEGPNASGRSTQITMLTSKLEADGLAVLNTGLRRSELISQGILEAKGNLVLGKRTISLYAGNASVVSPDVEGAIGRKPISFIQFATDYAHAFRPSSI